MDSNCSSIRSANISDLSGICEVERTSFARDPYPSSLLKKLILDSQSVSLVVIDQSGKITGYCISDNEGTRSHLISLAVLPNHRRMGVASRLLKELMIILRNRGIKEVRLEVRSDNDPAIELYRRSGFADEMMIRGYYSDASTALSMRMILR